MKGLRRRCDLLLLSFPGPVVSGSAPTPSSNGLLDSHCLPDGLVFCVPGRDLKLTLSLMCPYCNVARFREKSTGHPDKSEFQIKKQVIFLFKYISNIV